MAERNLPGAHMHDPLTLGVVIDPGFCGFERLGVDVDRLLAGRSDWLRGDCGSKPVQAAVAVDAPRFESFLTQRLTAAVLDRYRPNDAV
jgi:inosine-uridine nucleoside N-ribohydrolase